jgi:hypothetical protein
MSHPPQSPTGQQRSAKGRLGAVLATLAAIATILTFVFTYVIHSPSSPKPNPIPNPTTPNPGPASYSYSLSVQQGWMNDCEGNSNSVAKCQCELSYFEDRVSSQIFEQDYSAMGLPGVVPSQLAGASAECEELN